jgi:hypothetical protein
VGGTPQAPASDPLRQQFALLAQLSESDVPLTIVLVQGRMTEITDASELFPSFEPLRAAVQLGQDRAEFSTALPAHTVAEVLSSCFADTISRWVLPQITCQPAPFELGPALSAKLELILNGLAGSPGSESPRATSDRQSRSTSGGAHPGGPVPRGGRPGSSIEVGSDGSIYRV